jgi:NAD(P)-dependent dehydrogenase (short-subunit alcohol dehydrogenase family)
MAYDTRVSSVVVSGANRGIGLELCRQYAAEGWTVHAGCRNPGRAAALREVEKAHGARVIVHSLDVTEPASVARMASALGDAPLDVLVNNAGVFGPSRSGGDAGQSFGSVDYAAFEEVLRVNSLGPLRLSEALAGHLERAGGKVATISSEMGSIAATSGHYLAYRASKAAVNMAMASLAAELRPRGIAVVLLCPGWVRTDMGGPGAPLAPAQSARGLRERIRELSLSSSGRFLKHDGRRVAW